MKYTTILERLRSHGYTLPQSLAELADNSITHNAKNIWVYMFWSDDTGKNSFIMVVDDGNGMSEDELLNRALTFPDQENIDKGENNHSVFGAGLKTGSFNHCRSITIITKKNKLLKKTLNFKDGITNDMPSCINHRFIKSHLEKFEKKESGTIILWTDLDRITKLRAVDRGPNFYDDCDKSKKHFKLVYHKYLLEKKVNLYFNGTDEINRTKAFDPFYKSNSETIKLPDSEISFLKGGSTTLRPYIIPIDTGKENLGKSKNDLQGLYFLRNNRVIDYGGWFDLGEKNADKIWASNERYNRLRIEVTVPIETSKDWITTDKTKVIIPGYAESKIRKSLVQIRKDYLEKIGQMREDQEKEPVNETLKQKRELNRIINNENLDDEDLLKVKEYINKIKKN